jgi:ParB family chromosome partitioning protein
MATVKKPVPWYKDAPQVRQHYDESADRSLGESMLAHGQLQPVGARPDGALLWGHRRLRAARLVGMKELEVIITDKPLSESEIRIIQLIENLQRADLRDGEKRRAFEEWFGRNPGLTNKDLAENLKLSEATISKYMSVSRCTKDVQDALDDGRIGISTAYEISRVPADQQAELLCLRLSGASRDGLAERVRKQKRAGTPQVRAKRIVCPLPSGTSVVVTGRELSLDDFVEARGEAQKEAKKAREQSLDARTFAAVMKDKAKKGGG